MDGDFKPIKVFAVDDVAGTIGGIELGGKWARIREARRSSGPVDLLVGIGAAALHPRFECMRGDWSVFSSSFGTRFLAAGGAGSTATAGAARAIALVAGSREAVPPDFVTAEALGTDAPRRCVNCLGCRQCRYRNTQMSWQEAEELQMIDEGLRFDERAGRWIASYPYLVDPSIMVDNRPQALKMMESLERRLRRSGDLEAFDQVFNEAVQRGVYVPLEDPRAYRGPINYISFVVAKKSDPTATTPLRICANSSMTYRGRSLNDILAKGPSALADLFGVALKFRRWPVAVVRDIRKFYQSVASSERDQHLRRVLWRGGGEGEPITYVTATVNFGDRPAGAVSMTALRRTAAASAGIHPVAAKTIAEATYVDDTAGGGADRQEAEDVSDGMQRVASSGGFEYGDAVITGDAVEGGERQVLGIPWNPVKDIIRVEVRINYSPKVSGARIGPDQDLARAGGGADVGVPPRLTRRLVWRIALGQYDPLGLLAPFLLQFKLVMRDLVEEGAGNSGGDVWEAEVSSKVRASFGALLGMLGEAAGVFFPRCVLPVAAATDVWLLTFVDGSATASCALCYVSWPDGSCGGRRARLVCAKTRVAPLKKLTIPRLELQAAVIGVRLAARVQEGLGASISRRYFYTDSSAVLGILRGKLSTYREFVGTRAAEVRAKSSIPEEWRWVPTDANAADIGTRAGVRPSQLGPDSEYQNGPPWLARPEAEWPIKVTFGAVPAEEVRGPAAATAAAAVVAARAPGGGFPEELEPRRFSSWERLRTVMSVVLLAGRRFARRPPSPAAEGGDALRGVPLALVLARELRNEATLRLVAWAAPTAGWDLKKLAALRPSMANGGRGIPAVLHVRGRRGEALLPGGRPEGLPVVDGKSSLGVLIMRSAHERRHAGVARTVLESRRHVWVTRAAHLARAVVSRCTRCRRERAKPDEQLMAPLPTQRTTPERPFTHVAVDLFGPLSMRDSVRRRVKGEAYGFIAVCLATTATHIEICGGATADHVAMALRRMFSLRGTPKTIQSDPGTQMVAAGKEVQLWEGGPVAGVVAARGRGGG